MAVPSALSSQPDELPPTASMSARRVAAADVHPDALRAAALRQSQSGERLTSSAELRPTESIIAELPKRKTPWVAIVGLGAALAAGAAAYIQTEPELAPQGNRAVTPPPAKVEPKAEPPVKAEPPPTPTKVEPPPPDPVPIVAPPADPEPPPADVETEEPKKKKKRAKAAEPEEEEEDLFDQVRKHMEAKKAQEEAYRKAAEAGTSLPGPAPTPAATNPTPAPAPKPAAEDPATKAKDTLDRARQAAQQGNHPLAYSLAKQANSSRARRRPSSSWACPPARPATPTTPSRPPTSSPAPAAARSTAPAPATASLSEHGHAASTSPPAAVSVAAKSFAARERGTREDPDSAPRAIGPIAPRCEGTCPLRHVSFRKETLTAAPLTTRGVPPRHPPSPAMQEPLVLAPRSARETGAGAPESALGVSTPSAGSASVIAGPHAAEKRDVPMKTKTHTRAGSGYNPLHAV
ncbi:hypothetical protein [Nannocystis pusilla]|uniref:hypothetical protein n=1 Tax=Nannocystis pusilla TaxID=889268 RepID=UPI003B798984